MIAGSGSEDSGDGGGGGGENGYDSEEAERPGKKVKVVVPLRYRLADRMVRVRARVPVESILEEMQRNYLKETDEGLGACVRVVFFPVDFDDGWWW